MAYQLVPLSVKASNRPDIIGLDASKPAITALSARLQTGTTYFAKDTKITYILDDTDEWVNFNCPGEPKVEVSLVDDASYSLDDATNLFVIAKLGDTNIYYVVFFADPSGNFLDIASDYAKVAYSDSDGYLCIINTAGQVTIKNRIGSTQTLRIW